MVFLSAAMIKTAVSAHSDFYQRVLTCKKSPCEDVVVAPISPVTDAGKLAPHIHVNMPGIVGLQ